MSRASASCITMCWASDALSRMRPSIRYRAIAGGIISAICSSGWVAMAALYGPRFTAAQANPAICLDALAAGGLQ